MPGGLASILIYWWNSHFKPKIWNFQSTINAFMPNGWVVVCPYQKGLDYLFPMVYYLNIKNG
jgi:hypothetical protein